MIWDRIQNEGAAAQAWVQAALGRVAVAVAVLFGPAGAGAQTGLPYADPDGGRDGFPSSEHPINSQRVYHFYARQADHYLANPDAVPEILPPFPGIDGGSFGHWGKYSQNDHYDGRWNQMETGGVVSASFRGFGGECLKAICVSLGESGEISACFDPEALVYRWVWEPGFVVFGEFRFGLLDGIAPDGEAFLESRPEGGGDGGRFRGFYRAGDRVVFRYDWGGVDVLDSPGSIYSRIGKVFTRTVEFPAGCSGLSLPLFDRDPSLVTEEASELGGGPALWLLHKDDAAAAVARPGPGVEGVRLRVTGSGQVVVDVGEAPPGGRVKVYLTGGDRAALPFFEAKVVADAGPEADVLGSLLGGGPEPRWDWEWTAAGELGQGDQAYVIDRIPVPVDNPFRSPMFLTGHAFTGGGGAVVCTAMGDVWSVRGLDGALGEVRWRRFAAGLNQPMGLWADGTSVYVLGRDQITRLRDTDGDGEADHYESFCNAYPASAGGHDFATGLERGKDGHFYFAAGHLGVVKVAPDGSGVSTVATGIRNPNGIGILSGEPAAAVGGSELLTVGLQEGDWTPASGVVAARPGGFYGHGAKPGQAIDPPLVFVPRGIDNSTSEQVVAPPGDRWGPLAGQLVGLSFGAGTYYLILVDRVDETLQGAVVPMEGDFLAGPNRARFSPDDGQLYVTCSDGWGDYAIQDGAFHRVRFTGTGRPFAHPVGFHAHANGIRVEFTEPLEQAAVEDPGNSFAQQWNYEYSAAYGSAEFSLSQPDREGHDPVAIRSVRLLEDGRSAFVEMPSLRPSMQFHLRLRWRFADGSPAVTELFPTLLQLDDPFTAAPGLAAVDPGSATARRLALRVRWHDPADDTQEELEPGRQLTLRALPGLRFDSNELHARPGERVTLFLENADTVPHNVVVIRPGTLQRIGDLANRLAADPAAATSHYVPNSDAVLHHTILVAAGESGSVTFDAPTSRGIYPFVCTFPGHWMLMNGNLVVE